MKRIKEEKQNMLEEEYDYLNSLSDEELAKMFLELTDKLPCVDYEDLTEEELREWQY